ncbi:polysaccharide deacetylase family protein [Aestuariirhabdus sp. Z084]|uniref:polysaccharide deacetylase family protein n=1 Tax=Aestuariirhabdus haliotis TaxID=2918751 RepID=UPI00201B45A5|nr:polysaccharide deacetylase family protein [Aestuariirhabdus haliotis]MCL6414692.1 polysaccharide deacetylase family protein [Aestuariirhabdus haliotis]MCL6418624.1 polysaccharide deacetylase family protein [Aestuariirhabdus haliotis]
MIIESLQASMAKCIGQTALMYHSIASDDWHWSLSMSNFEAHLEALKLSKLSASSVCNIDGKRSNSDILLTFDDGYCNNIGALESVTSAGFSATVFVITECIGRKSHWQPGNKALPLLDKSEIRYLAESGIEIGMHGFQHTDMTTIPPEALLKQLRDGKSKLEDSLGCEIKGLAYPYGCYNEKVIEIAKDCKFHYAMTTESGRISASSSNLQLKRLTIDNSINATKLQRMLINGSNDNGYDTLFAYLADRAKERLSYGSHSQGRES